MVQILFALAMIGLAIAFGVEAAGYNATAARTPVLLSWVVGLLALGMLAEAALKRRREVQAVPAAPPVQAGEAYVGSSLPRALFFLVLVVLYTASFQVAGFVLASIVFLGVTLLLFRATSLHLSLLTMVLAIGVIYGVFVGFLRLPIPLWPAF